MLKNFYRNKQRDTVSKLKDFFSHDFYKKFPRLKGRTSVIVTGSTARGYQDKYSDIDVEIVFANKKLRDFYLKKIIAYKNHVSRVTGIVHIRNARKLQTYKDIDVQLKSWKHDHLLWEYSHVLIIEDPKNTFLRMSKQYSNYPKHILFEKAGSLLSEIIQRSESYTIATARKKLYFAETERNNLIRLFLNAILLFNRKYPAFDKHLFEEVENADYIPRELMSIIKRLMKNQKAKQNAKLIQRAQLLVESSLVSRRIITKHPTSFWKRFRSPYSISFSTQ